jgi:hypothetical protein
MQAPRTGPHTRPYDKMSIDERGHYLGCTETRRCYVLDMDNELETATEAAWDLLIQCHSRDEAVLVEVCDMLVEGGWTFEVAFQAVDAAYYTLRSK